MGRKEGKSRHRSGNIVPMYQGNQEHYVGKGKVKQCNAVSETNNKQQEEYGNV